MEFGLVVGLDPGEPVFECEQALAAGIMPAKSRMCPARASRCGQPALTAASRAWSPSSRLPGRDSSQRVISRVFGTAGAGVTAGPACRSRWTYRRTVCGLPA